MSKMAVIINPVARRFNDKVESQLSQFLREEGLDFELFKTTGTEKANGIELTKQAVNSGFDTVVAAGGNGTCNQVITGLMQSLASSDEKTTKTFGLIPLGLGNEFARSAGIPLSLPEACHCLARGRIRFLDIGQVSLPDKRTIFFSSTLGIGFNGKVALAAEKIRWSSFLPMFVWMTIKSVAVYNRATIMEIQFDGQRVCQPCLMLVIGNGQLEGSVFQVTPQAELDDGLLDLLLVSKINRLQILQFIPIFIKGKHIGKKPISLFRIRQAQIKSLSEPMVAHIDGEIFSDNNTYQLEVKILPGQLKLLS